MISFRVEFEDIRHGAFGKRAALCGQTDRLVSAVGLAFDTSDESSPFQPVEDLGQPA